MRDYVLNAPTAGDVIGELRTDPKTDEMRFRFTRNLTVHVTLSKFKGRARFADDFPEDVASFKRMGTSFAQCVSFLSLSTKLSPQELEELSESFQKFRPLNLEAYDELQLMLARVLLYSCGAARPRSSSASDQNGNLPWSVRPRSPRDLLALDALGVVVLFVSAALLSSTLLSRLNKLSGTAIVIGLKFSLNDCVAATVALFQKSYGASAALVCTRERPSQLCGLCNHRARDRGCSLAFLPVRTHFPFDNHPVLPFPAQCKWLLCPTTLGFRAQLDRFEAREEASWLRGPEGAGMAAS